MSCANTAKVINLLLVVDSGELKEAQIQSYSPGGANAPSCEDALAPLDEYN